MGVIGSELPIGEAQPSVLPRACGRRNHPGVLLWPGLHWTSSTDDLLPVLIPLGVELSLQQESSEALERLLKEYCKENWARNGNKVTECVTDLQNPRALVSRTQP